MQPSRHLSRSFNVHDTQYFNSCHSDKTFCPLSKISTDLHRLDPPCLPLPCRPVLMHTCAFGWLDADNTFHSACSRKSIAFFFATIDWFSKYSFKTEYKGQQSFQQAPSNPQLFKEENESPQNE